MERDISILLLAPYADPNDVGESWSTFQWIEGIMNHYPSTTLLTMHKAGKDISSCFPDREVISWCEFSLFSRFERFNAMLKPSYTLFYYKARRWIKKELSKGRRWELAHQISPLALRYPSPIYDLKLPYIIGPLAGSVNVPAPFTKEMKSSVWYSKFRSFDDFRFSHDPQLHKTYSNSSILIGVAPYVKELLKGIEIKRFEILNETGVVGLPQPGNVTHPDNNQKDCFNILYVGRLIRSKGARDLIRAISLIKDLKRIHVDILGDGEDRAACEKEAKSFNIKHLITFHGKIKRKEVDDFYRDADIFVLPSFKEPSGNVILEAMSHGLPMIVWNGGGPGYYAKESFAVKIEADSPTDYSQKLASSIKDLYASPDRIISMGLAAKREVLNDHLWNKKIKKLTTLYDSLKIK